MVIILVVFFLTIYFDTWIKVFKSEAPAALNTDYTNRTAKLTLLIQKNETDIIP